MSALVLRAFAAATLLIQGIHSPANAITPADVRGSTLTGEQALPAVGKLVNETGAWCSGVVISRDTILTAAHCLFNRRTLRFIAPTSLHFLAGYHMGRYASHAEVISYEIGPGFDPLRYGETLEADWAILKTAEVLPSNIIPLKLANSSVRSGTAAMMIGYSQLRAHAQTADKRCELQDEMITGRLLLHTCDAEKGFSGAPILVRVDGDVQIAGIQIASIRTSQNRRMLAIPAQALERATERWRTAPDQLQADCSLKDNVVPRLEEGTQQYFSTAKTAALLAGLEETSAQRSPAVIGVPSEYQPPYLLGPVAE